MKSKKVTRHYCDFCGKGMFRKPSMIHHEEVCTKNINRRCGMCEKFAGQRDFNSLIEKTKEKCKEVYNLDKLVGLEATQETLDWLRKEVDGCPACILTILRLGHIMGFKFNYKKQHEDFWHEQMELEREQAEWATY